MFSFFFIIHSFFNYIFIQSNRKVELHVSSLAMEIMLKQLGLICTPKYTSFNNNKNLDHTISKIYMKEKHGHRILWPFHKKKLKSL